MSSFFFFFFFFFKSLVSGVWQATYASAAVIAGPIGGVLYAQVTFNIHVQSILRS